MSPHDQWVDSIEETRKGLWGEGAPGLASQTQAIQTAQHSSMMNDMAMRQYGGATQDVNIKTDGAAPPKPMTPYQMSRMVPEGTGMSDEEMFTKMGGSKQWLFQNGFLIDTTSIHDGNNHKCTGWTADVTDIGSELRAIRQKRSKYHLAGETEFEVVEEARFIAESVKARRDMMQAVADEKKSQPGPDCTGMETETAG